MRMLSEKTLREIERQEQNAENALASLIIWADKEIQQHETREKIYRACLQNIRYEIQGGKTNNILLYIESSFAAADKVGKK